MKPRTLHCAGMLYALLDLVFSDCDVKIALKSGQEIELTSPNYPSNFSRHLHCFYDLTSQFNSGDILRVSVLDVTLACDDPDTSLEVFDAFSGSTKSLGKVCAGGVSKLESPKERLYLVFRSEGDPGNPVTSKGFKLNVMAVPEFSHCYNHQAKVLSVTSETQHIISPYYPVQVAPNVHCRWLLKAPAGQKVLLDIISADMKGSNSCFSFGLYIFDGKTTYDDKRMGLVCTNDSQSFHSTGNYMMVVFTSGAHVMHSGAGVKLGYYSTFADSGVVEKDSSLLFILIGVLLGIASFTIIMVILRFIVIPARRQALNRQYCPRNSNISSSSVATLTIYGDPPPPYDQTVPSTHREKRHGLCASACGCCFSGGKPLRERNSGLNTRHFINDFPFVSGNGELGSEQFITPQILSALAGYSRNTVLSLDQLRSGTAENGLPSYSRETTANASVNRGQFNEYHELPLLSRPERVSGSITAVAVVDNSVSSSFPVEREVSNSSNIRLFGSNNCTVGQSVTNSCTVGQSVSNNLNNEQSVNNSVAVGQSNVRQVNDSDYQVCDVEEESSTNDALSRGVHNSAKNMLSGCNSSSGGRDSNNSVIISLANGAHEGNVSIYEVDGGGYEVPVVARMYDRLRDGARGDDGEDGEEEEEGVYDTLHFSSEEASVEESGR